MVKTCIPSCRRLCNCWTNSTTRYQFNKQLIKESTATWQCSCHHFTVSHDLVRGLVAQDKYDSKALRGLWKEIEKPSKQAFSWCDFSSRIIPAARRQGAGGRGAGGGEYNAVIPCERALRSWPCQWFGEGQVRRTMNDIMPSGREEPRRWSYSTRSGFQVRKGSFSLQRRVWFSFLSIPQRVLWVAMEVVGLKAECRAEKSQVPTRRESGIISHCSFF